MNSIILYENISGRKFLIIFSSMNPESYSLYYFTFNFNSNQSSSLQSSIVHSLGTNSINI